MLNKSNIFLLCIALWFSQASVAQSRCGFDVVHKKILDRSAVYKTGVEALEKVIQSRNQMPHAGSGIQGQLGTAAALYTVPVVIHVIHTGGAVGSLDNPSDAQLTGAIDYLNSVYNGTMPGIEGVGDIQIQFQLASRDPNCSATSGINRVDGSSITSYASKGVNVFNTDGVEELDIKNLVRWDPTKYYNVWVVNKFDGQDGTSGTFVGGFAYFPGAPSTLDGTMILATQMATNKKTLPHEMGHAFAVYHPFQGSSGSTCATESDCSLDGDRVCDTDPITQSFSCRTGTNACTGTPYSDNTEHNFMSYSGCSTLFTAGQKARMLSAAASSFRNYSGSWALSSTYPVTPFNAPGSASCSPVTSPSGLASNFGGVMELSLNGITVKSSTSFSDGGYRNNSTSCQSLYYLQEGQTYSISLRLYGLNAEQAKVWIDFDNNGIFNNAEEYLGGVDELATPGSRTGGLTISVPVNIPASAVKDQVIRMRVVEDLSVIYGPPAISTACTDPVYGQAEDYPVFIRSLALLPVDLIRFTASPDGNDVRLSWETALEQNSAYFDVERSTNGKDYLTVGSVAAKGSPSAYQFTDRGIPTGEYYYRLRQVDKDNRAALSKTVRVNIGLSTAGYRILNNPASSYVDLSLPAQRTATTLNLVDVSGRILKQQVLGAGTTQFRLEGIEQFSPGLYFIQVVTGNEKTVLKFIKK